MNRPQKIREIYAELRDVTNGTISSAELLECAAVMVRSAEGYDIRPRYDLHTGPTPFEELSLDVLVEKWGWKLVCRDLPQEAEYFHCDSPARLVTQLLEAA